MIKPLLFLAVITALAWQGYAQYEVHQAQKLALAAPASAEVPVTPVALATVSIPDMQAATAQRFQCDGRIHCSQMRSCDEASFFLKNCPGTKMDGDHDGLPCERGPCD